MTSDEMKNLIREMRQKCGQLRDGVAAIDPASPPESPSYDDLCEVQVELELHASEVSATVDEIQDKKDEMGPEPPSGP